MMKITKEGLAFKTTWGAKLFKMVLSLSIMAFVILVFGTIRVS